MVAVKNGINFQGPGIGWGGGGMFLELKELCLERTKDT